MKSKKHLNTWREGKIQVIVNFGGGNLYAEIKKSKIGVL